MAGDEFEHCYFHVLYDGEINAREVTFPVPAGMDPQTFLEIIEHGPILAAHLAVSFPRLAHRPWTVTYRQIITESSYRAMFPTSPVAHQFATAQPGDDDIMGDAWEPSKGPHKP